jgi:hypothetical protein
VNAWFSTTNNGVHSRRLAVDAVTQNAYAAADPEGIFFSTDHGSTWTAATTQPADPSVEDIAVAPTSKLYAATATKGVFTSTDDGVTWSDANGSTTPLGDLNTISIAGDPSDASGKTVYVATGSDVFVTTDAGATAWASASTNGFSADTSGDTATALAVDATGTVFAGGASGDVYELTGGTWVSTALGNTHQIDSLVFNSTNLFAGAHDGTIFRFSSGAWNSGVATGTHAIVQIAFASATTGYAASAGDGVFKTTDGGGTTDWTAVNTGITNLAVRGVAVDAATATTVFAGTDGAGFFETLTAGQ